MKPFTSKELNVLSGLMLTLERDISLTYGNRNGRFANAKLIDADDDKFVIELKNGVQDDTTNRVHTDITVASRKHPGVILQMFEEEALMVDDDFYPDGI
jgi:hypothetical protein